jgi:hypothetical protein
MIAPEERQAMEGPAAELIRVLLRWLKEGPPGAIPITHGGRTLGALVAVTWEDAGDADALERLCRWHTGEPPPAPATIRRWLQQHILPSEDRVLFWIKDADGGFAGHVGLRGVDFPSRRVLSGYLVSVRPLADPLIRGAEEALAGWASGQLGLTVVPAPTTRGEAA